MGDKIKKLSDAILIGATIRPQCRGILFSGDEKSCALGAAIEAIGWKERCEKRGYEGGESVVEFWKAFDERFGINGLITGEIAWYNDCECLTREQIASRLKAKGL